MPKGDSGCAGCALECLSKGFVAYPHGLGALPVLIIGEALGEAEVLAKQPFVGPAGKVLTRLIERTKDPVTGAALDRNDFWVANVIACQPPGNELAGAPYEKEAIQHCSPNLERTIADFHLLHPTGVCLALGNTAMRWLTGEVGIEHWRGSVMASRFGWVVPTFHPSYIMRGKWNLAQVVIHDLLRALHIARNGIQQENPNFLEDPSLQACGQFQADWVAAGRPALAADIETNYSEGADETELEELSREDDASYIINRVGFAYQREHAISVPYSAPYIDWLQEMFEEADELVWWNAAYDLPRLKANGHKFKPHTKQFDAMHAHHFLHPSIPYGLQFASSLHVGHSYSAWKHLSSLQPAWYNARDCEYTIRCYQVLKAGLQAAGKQGTFDRHFTDFMAALARMSDRGVASDAKVRAGAKGQLDTLIATSLREIQAYIPNSLRPSKTFKISKERLEKKFGPLGPEWIEVTEQLSAKEEARLVAREAKAAVKAATKASKPPRKARKKKGASLVEVG